MSQSTWNAVDDDFNAALQPPDEALAGSDAAGRPALAVAPNRGKGLHLMTQSMFARVVADA